MGVLAVRNVLWAAVAALLLASCDIETPTNGKFDDQQVFSDAGDASVGLDMGDEAIIVNTFDGTWLHFSQLSTCVTLIRTEESISRTLFLVEADYDDDTGFVDEVWTACRMEFPVVLNLETFITEALLETSYPIESTDGFVSGFQVGAGYTSGQLAELWGWDTEDRHRDPFPIDVDDPRIIDSDEDGNPGATVLVSDQCENFIVQRALTTWQGHYVAPDRIEGFSVSHTDQLTVGATTPLCATPYASRANDSRNVFARVRIDGQGNSLNLDADGDGQITCDEILPVWENLFTRVPPDDDYCL